jgi:hypothetical protein
VKVTLVNHRFIDNPPVFLLSISTWADRFARDQTTALPRRRYAHSHEQRRFTNRKQDAAVTEAMVVGLPNESSATSPVPIEEDDLGPSTVGATRSNGRVQAWFLLKEEVV